MAPSYMPTLAVVAVLLLAAGQAAAAGTARKLTGAGGNCKQNCSALAPDSKCVGAVCVCPSGGVLGNHNNCGACGTDCTSLLNVKKSKCANNACAIDVCEPGYANCDGVAASGCNIDISTDVLNCGRCGNVVSFPNAAAQCVGGYPVMGACNSGFADNDPAIPGCETSTGCAGVDLMTDSNNCGFCGFVCSTNVQCVNGNCAVAGGGSGNFNDPNAGLD